MVQIDRCTYAKAPRSGHTSFIAEPRQLIRGNSVWAGEHAAVTLGLVVTVFAMPFGNAIAIPFLNGNLSGNRLAGLFLLLTYVFHRVKLRDFDMGRYRVTTPLIYLIIWCIFALAWCPASEYWKALISVFSLIQIAILLHIIYEYLQSRNTLRVAAFAYLAGMISIAGSAALGISSWTVDPAEFDGRLVLSIYGSGYQNANELANHAVAGLLALIFALWTLDRWLRVVAVAVSLLLLWIVLASGSRGAILSGMVALMAVAVWPSSKRRIKQNIAILLMGMIVCAAGVYLTSRLNDRAAARFDVGRIVRGVIDSRWGSVEAGLKYVFVEGHLLGAGRVGGCWVENTRIDEDNVVHCMPVAWMADLGLPSILIYLFLVGRVLRVVHQMPFGSLRYFCQALAVFTLLVGAKGGGTGYSLWMWLMLGVVTAVAHGESFGWAQSPETKGGRSLRHGCGLVWTTAPAYGNTG